MAMPCAALDRSLTSVEESQLLGNLKKDPSNTKSRRFLISHYHKLKQWRSIIQLAAPAYKKLTVIELQALAEAYVYVAQSKDALTTVKYINDNNPPSARTTYIEALAESQKINPEDQFKEAKDFQIRKTIELIKTAIQLSPQIEEAYLLWVLILEKTKASADEILGVYRRYDQANKQKSEHLRHKCELHLNANFLEEAIAVCSEAIKFDKQDVDSFVYKGKAYQRLEQKDLAKSTFAAAAKEFASSPLAQQAMADFFLNEKNWLEASQFYSNAIRLNPNNPDTHLGFAESLFNLRQYSEALKAYRANCNRANKIADEFKAAYGRVRAFPKLHRKYERTINTCRKKRSYSSKY